MQATLSERQNASAVAVVATSMAAVNEEKIDRS